MIKGHIFSQGFDFHSSGLSYEEREDRDAANNGLLPTEWTCTYNICDEIYELWTNSNGCDECVPGMTKDYGIELKYRQFGQDEIFYPDGGLKDSVEFTWECGDESIEDYMDIEIDGNTIHVDTEKSLEAEDANDREYFVDVIASIDGEEIARDNFRIHLAEKYECYSLETGEVNISLDELLGNEYDDDGTMVNYAPIDAAMVLYTDEYPDGLRPGDEGYIDPRNLEVSRNCDMNDYETFEDAYILEIDGEYCLCFENFKLEDCDLPWEGNAHMRVSWTGGDDENEWDEDRDSDVWVRIYSEKYMQELYVESYGYNGTYDGKEHGITVYAPEGATVMYGTEAGTYELDESPTFTTGSDNYVFYKVSKKGYADNEGCEVVALGPKHIDRDMIQRIAAIEYTGSAITPDVVLKDGESIIDPADYQVEFYNNLNAGTATVLVIADSEKYAGAARRTFEITPVEVVAADLYVSNAGDQTWLGEGVTIRPDVTVEYAGKTLIRNVDYAITYDSNNTIGNKAGGLYITLINNYKFAPGGSYQQHFNIVADDAIAALSHRVNTLAAQLNMALNPMTVSVTGVTTSAGTLKFSTGADITGYQVSINGELAPVPKEVGQYAAVGLDPGMSYEYTVIPYVVVDEGTPYEESVQGASKIATVKTQPAKVSAAPTVTAGKKLLYVNKWNKAAGAAKYQISVSTSKTGTTVKSTVTSVKKVTVKSLKSKKTYYVKVRAVSKDGVAGAWSAVKKVTVK